MKIVFQQARVGRNQGFSLLELLLTLVLILGLMTASVIQFTGAFDRTGLDEGSERLVTMIRFAQAEAATSGRKVRLSFEQPENGDTEQTNLRDIRVSWEPDTLGRPGQFESLARRSWNDGSINELVGVHQVRPLTDAGADPFGVEEDETPGFFAVIPEENAAPGFDAVNRAAGWFDSDDDTMVQSNALDVDASQHLTFYPDGSCDAMEIILASRKPEDKRLIAVRVQGVLGTVTRSELDPESDTHPDSDPNSPFDMDRPRGGSPLFQEPEPARSGTATDNWAERLLSRQSSVDGREMEASTPLIAARRSQ